jgi:hypothetical protein
MTELAVHPVAALFPMLADDELEELAAGHQTPAPAWQDIKHLPLRDGLVGEIHMLTFIIITVLLYHRVENLLSLYRWLVCIAARPRIHSREPFDPAPKRK